MTNEKLKKRMRLVVGKPLIPKAEPIKVLRRGENFIEMELDDGYDHDDFFDFEKDLVEIQSSRNLAKKAPGSDLFFETEENTSSQKVPSYIAMDEKVEESTSNIVIIPPKESSHIVLEDIEGNSEEGNANYEFIRCEALKKNGERCKRQAPKGKTICSVHQRALDKSSINKKESG